MSPPNKHYSAEIPADKSVDDLQPSIRACYNALSKTTDPYLSKATLLFGGSTAVDYACYWLGLTNTLPVLDKHRDIDFFIIHESSSGKLSPVAIFEKQALETLFINTLGYHLEKDTTPNVAGGQRFLQVTLLKDDAPAIDLSWESKGLHEFLLSSGQCLIDPKNKQIYFKNKKCYEAFMSMQLFTPNLETIIERAAKSASAPGRKTQPGILAFEFLFKSHFQNIQKKFTLSNEDKISIATLMNRHSSLLHTIHDKKTIETLELLKYRENTESFDISTDNINCYLDCLILLSDDIDLKFFEENDVHKIRQLFVRQVAAFKKNHQEDLIEMLDEIRNTLIRNSRRFKICKLIKPIITEQLDKLIPKEQSRSQKPASTSTTADTNQVDSAENMTQIQLLMSQRKSLSHHARKMQLANEPWTSKIIDKDFPINVIKLKNHWLIEKRDIKLNQDENHDITVSMMQTRFINVLAIPVAIAFAYFAHTFHPYCDKDDSATRCQTFLFIAGTMVMGSVVIIMDIYQSLLKTHRVQQESMKEIIEDVCHAVVLKKTSFINKMEMLGVAILLNQFVILDKQRPLDHFIISFSSLMSLKNKNETQQSLLIQEGLSALAAVHHDNLIDCIMENEVPEILAFELPVEEKMLLLREHAEALRRTIVSPYSYNKSAQMIHQANFMFAICFLLWAKTDYVNINLPRLHSLYRIDHDASLDIKLDMINQDKPLQTTFFGSLLCHDKQTVEAAIKSLDTLLVVNRSIADEIDLLNKQSQHLVHYASTFMLGSDRAYDREAFESSTRIHRPD